MYTKASQNKEVSMHNSMSILTGQPVIQKFSPKSILKFTTKLCRQALNFQANTHVQLSGVLSLLWRINIR